MEYRNHLGDSERPEGPYLVEFHKISQWNDLKNNRFRSSVKSLKWALSPLEIINTVIHNKGVNAQVFSLANGSAPPFSRPAAKVLSDIYPEKILLTALKGEDLTSMPDTVMQDVIQHRVSFKWKGLSYIIYINCKSDMITACEVVRSFPYDIFWNAWGDITERIYYSMWQLEPNGIRYPLQFDYERNGSKSKVTLLTELSFNQDIPDSLFKIPESVKKGYNDFIAQTVNDYPLSWGKNKINKVADGIIQIAGNWNTTIVKQDDGIVILEAPISTGYSAKVIAEAHKRFPGVPIKALVTASDAWWHIAGVREYVARGIPVYANAMNKPILERLIKAPHTLFPDSLEKFKRKPRFHFVSGRMEIGSGKNRIILIPVRTESLERLMIAYFPELQLAYTSEMIQPNGKSGFFWEESLLEAEKEVEKEKLKIKTFIGMHMEPTAWTEMTTYLHQYLSGK